jgi:hypothetical protein
MVRPNGRKLRRKEKKLENTVFKDFENQREYIVREYRKKLAKKGIDDDIDDIFDELDDTIMIDHVIESAEDTIKFGANYRIGKEKLGRFGIKFDLDHPLAVEYLQTDRPLVLAKMKDTTKDLIKPLLKEAVEKGTSPQELADLLSENFAFSRERSLMIAVNETGHAYEYGNQIPMQDLAEEGYTVKKKWQTVNDDRVTEECRANQAMGWIDIDENFDSGDSEPPREGNPRCRCTTLWEFKE